MPEITVEVDFACECESCGKDLTSTAVKRRGVWVVEVSPCQNCIKTASEEGKETGRAECEATHEEKE